MWGLNTFTLNQEYAGNARLLYQVNVLCIPTAVVYNEKPREKEVCSLKAIRVDEMAHQKASIVHSKESADRDLLSAWQEALM